MVDFDADLSQMDDDELLEYQQQLTRTRLAAVDKGRQVQAELDERAHARAARRAEEDQRLGQVTKPPTQNVFGPAPEALGS